MRNYVGIAILALASVAGARAAATLDFAANTIAGGSVSYAGGGASCGAGCFTGGSLVGTNIPLLTLSAVGTPLNAGNFTLTSGVLNFTTSTVTAQDFGGGFWGYRIAAGGSFTIAASLVTPSGLTGTLITGTFNANLFPFTANNISNLTGSATGSSSLLSYFGFGNGVTFTLNFLNTGGGGPPAISSTGGFSTTGNAYSTDLNLSSLETVPEPTSVIFLGTFLLGTVALVRRTIKARQTE